VITPASNRITTTAAIACSTLQATRGHIAQPIAKPAGVLIVSEIASNAPNAAITPTTPA
jgi:hypothetical protein